MSLKLSYLPLDVWQDILCRPDSDLGLSLCAFTMNMAGTVLMTLFWSWHCPPPAPNMTANFLLTGELNVGWFLALVRDHPDGLAKSVPLIFKVTLKICNQLAYLIFSRQDGNPLQGNCSCNLHPRTKPSTISQPWLILNVVSRIGLILYARRRSHPSLGQSEG